MQPMEVAAITLLAVLVGASLPVLLQARATLRSAEQLLDNVSGRLAQSLQEVTETTREFSTVARDLDATLRQVRGSVATVTAVGSAVGPALVAALQAFRALRAADAAAPNPAPDQPATATGSHAAQQEVQDARISGL